MRHDLEQGSPSQALMRLPERAKDGPPETGDSNRGATAFADLPDMALGSLSSSREQVSPAPAMSMPETANELLPESGGPARATKTPERLAEAPRQALSSSRERDRPSLAPAPTGSLSSSREQVRLSPASPCVSETTDSSLPQAGDPDCRAKAMLAVPETALRLLPSSCKPIIDEIQEQWRQRQIWHRAEKSLTLQARALCRRFAFVLLGSSASLKAVKDEAAKIYESALGDRSHAFADNALAAMLPLCAARDGLATERKRVEKRLKLLAGQLPAARFVEETKGIALNSLAAIVGEAGDLSRYPDRDRPAKHGPAALWKRLGFAPYDGLAGSTWKRDSWRPRALSKDEWIENPFSGQRYAVMHEIALALHHAQCEGKAKSGTAYGRPKGEYGAAYVRRREHTAVTHPDWTAQHAHFDALRYMMKRLLRDLWKAWRQASQGMPEMAIEAMPAA